MVLTSDASVFVIVIVVVVCLHGFVVAGRVHGPVSPKDTVPGPPPPSQHGQSRHHAPAQLQGSL